MSTLDHLSTRVEVQSLFSKICYKDNIMMAGSCFAEHMVIKCKRYKYNVSGNPFGILYNPIALARSFERISNKEHYLQEELVNQDGLFHSMDHHGSFSGESAETVLKRINESIDISHHFLSQSKWLFISLGTSRVFRYKDTGNVVGNNHKIPRTHFEELSLSVDDCVEALNKLLETTKKLTPDVNIILTVSPIRHLKDGLINNNRSKAALILAIEQIIKLHPATNYFPAYELMVDELRDYRFYARDLIHPSETAIDIIWEELVENYFDPNERDQHQALEKIMKAKEHRILHSNKTNTRLFAEGQLKNIDQLSSLFPELNLNEERQYFFRMIEPD